MGSLLELHALAGLGADVQQAHPGVLDAQKPPGVVSAHKGELEQVLRGALGGGPAVNEDHIPPGIGHHRGQGRPADAPDAFDEQGGRRQQGSGGTGGDESLPPALLEQAQAHGHGGVWLVLKGPGGVVLHLNDLAGGGDLHPRGRGGVAQLGQAGPDLRRPAGEQNLHAQFPDRPQGSLHRGLGGVVAPHGIHDDSHRYAFFLVPSSPNPARISRDRWDRAAFLFRFPFTR